jgi:hypothetical protein
MCRNRIVGWYVYIVCNTDIPSNFCSQFHSVYAFLKVKLLLCLIN